MSASRSCSRASRSRRAPAGRAGPDASDRLRPPQSSPAGPSRPAPLQLVEEKGDLLALPTYIWYPSSPEDSLRLRGVLVLGVDLGGGYYAQIREVTSGLLFYRRLQELGLVRIAGLDGVQRVLNVGGHAWVSMIGGDAVSYTHLTLPTRDLV